MENTSYQPTDKFTFEQVWAAFMESRAQLEKNGELLQQTRELLDQKFQETDRQMKNLAKKMSDLDNNWGKFVEALVDGALVDMLNDYGVNVLRTSTREKGFYAGRQFEFDIIAKNGDDIVIVEVKTTLQVKHIKDFIENLELAKEVLPEYSNKRLLGAIAFIHANEKAELYAENKGLFVIKAVGKSAILINRSEFMPKEW